MIVPPHIVDDANLHIETMLLAMRVWTEAREAAGEPAQMPERAHFQVDGASTNGVPRLTLDKQQPEETSHSTILNLKPSLLLPQSR